VSGVDGAREREHARTRRVKRGELTIPKRFSTLRVSMVCNVGISTRSSECSGLKGMMDGRSEVSSCAVCGERDGCWCTLMCGVRVGMRVGEVWSNGSRRSECYVSASIGRIVLEVC
jgi:hypothetical protein